MISVDIADQFYFFRYPLEAAERLERVFGPIQDVCNYKEMTQKNIVGLLWTGLYVETAKGELQHVFCQSKRGIPGAVDLSNQLVKEKGDVDIALAFIFAAAHRAFTEDKWFGSSTPTEGEVSDKAPKSLVQTYKESYEKHAYGLGGLKPSEFSKMTPAEFELFITARVDYRDSEMRFTDAQFATLKSLMLGIAGKKNTPKDFLIMQNPASEAPSEEEVLENMKKTMHDMMIATGGKTI